MVGARGESHIELTFSNCVAARNKGIECAAYDDCCVVVVTGLDSNNSLCLRKYTAGMS